MSEPKAGGGLVPDAVHVSAKLPIVVANARDGRMSKADRTDLRCRSRRLSISAERIAGDGALPNDATERSSLMSRNTSSTSTLSMASVSRRTVFRFGASDRDVSVSSKAASTFAWARGGKPSSGGVLASSKASITCLARPGETPGIQAASAASLRFGLRREPTASLQASSSPKRPCSSPRSLTRSAVSRVVAPMTWKGLRWSAFSGGIRTSRVNSDVLS